MATETVRNLPAQFIEDIGKDLESPLETAINDFKKSGFRND